MFIGTMSGNIIGTLYLLAYQAIGILIAYSILKSEKHVFKVLMGSVIGSVGLHWCPIIFSFMLQFTKASHICGLVLFAIIGVCLYVKKGIKDNNGVKDSIKNYPVLICAIPLFIFFCMMLWNHTLITNDAGGYATGQCGYGDMNMHLGFITSMANQQSFPPHYSIFPDARLSYPFLSDSISASVYLWGASLRYAYMLPMWIAILQVMCGMYLFAEEWLGDKWKAFLAYVLFFFNGGFGIVYFFNGYKTFDDLMHGFYNTPTNLVDVNVRWTNVIVDMLLPQRATLFGWAVLFPVLILLRRAWVDRRKDYFILVAILGGALPMIHTHSFLALGLISFGWLIGDVAKRSGVFEWDDNRTAKLRAILAVLCIVPIIFLSLISNTQRTTPEGINPDNYLKMGIAGVVVLLIFCGFMFVKLNKEDKMQIVKSWGTLLVIVLLIAFPQLFYWTFKQVSEGEMLRGSFNWSNTGDIAEPYIMYYLKNIGLVAILFIPAWILSKKKDIAHVFPALIIWFLCEFVVFQPNLYDNNKLLLAAYMLICCFVAGSICDGLRALFGVKKGIIKTAAKYVTAAILIVVVTISGFLTMVREYYSGTPASWYELYSKDLLDACAFIEENTSVNDTILTANNHNNAVASLTGRDIVCGSSTFLYFHGFDTYEREMEVKSIYENITDPNSELLIKKYGVDFILVSGNEYSFAQNINEQAIYETYPCVYSTETVRIYQVR